MRTEKKPIEKITTLHVQHTLYISLPSLHDYDVKMPNFTFCRRCNTRQRLSFSFPEPRYSLLEFKSRKTKWTRWNKRDKVKCSFCSRRRRGCLYNKLPNVHRLKSYSSVGCSLAFGTKILLWTSSVWSLPKAKRQNQKLTRAYIGQDKKTKLTTGPFYRRCLYYYGRSSFNK